MLSKSIAPELLTYLSSSSPVGHKATTTLLIVVIVSITGLFYGVGLLAPRPTPIIEDQVLGFVWSLLLDLPGLVKPARALSPRRYIFLSPLDTQAPSPSPSYQHRRGIPLVYFCEIKSLRKLFPKHGWSSQILLQKLVFRINSWGNCSLNITTPTTEIG